VLLNTLEWKEVQWKGQLDNLVLQHAAEVAKLKRELEFEASRNKDLRTQLDEQIVELADLRRSKPEIASAAPALYQQMEWFGERRGLSSLQGLSGSRCLRRCRRRERASAAKVD